MALAAMERHGRCERECILKYCIVSGNLRKGFHLLVSNTTRDNKWEETSTATMKWFEKKNELQYWHSKLWSHTLRSEHLLGFGCLLFRSWRVLRVREMLGHDFLILSVAGWKAGTVVTCAAATVCKNDCNC